MQSRLSTICLTRKLNKSHFHLKRATKALSIFTQQLGRIEFVANQSQRSNRELYPVISQDIPCKVTEQLSKSCLNFKQFKTF